MPRPPLSERWIWPGLIIAMVVGNQLWTVSGLDVGQMISWSVDLAALLIVLRFFRGRSWPVVLAVAIVLARMIGSGYQGNSPIDVVYLSLLNVLFCAAGVAMALRFAPLVRRQLLKICFFCSILMVLQTSGAGEWTQMLATENEGQPKTPQPTLFVEQGDLDYQTIQARPSGFLHSNNFLSVVVLFALALQLGSLPRRRSVRWDAVLAAMAVLAMAKIVWLTSAVMIGWLMCFGSSRQRRRMLRLVLLFVAMMSIYSFLFPGLFDTSTGRVAMSYSVLIRVNNMVDRLDPTNPVAEWLTPFLEGTYRLEREAPRESLRFSGYTPLVIFAPYLLGLGVLTMPVFFRGLRRLRSAGRSMGRVSETALLAGIVVVLYPAAVPLFAAPLYWFIVGFAVVPFVVRLRPRWLGAQDQAPPRHRTPIAAPAGT